MDTEHKALHACRCLFIRMISLLKKEAVLPFRPFFFIKLLEENHLTHNSLS